MNDTVSCAEFQQHLPELFASGNIGVTLDPILAAHIGSCAQCSALVRDLKYIADQARLLLEPAVEEPSDAVWANIQNKLKDAPISDDPE